MNLIHEPLAPLIPGRRTTKPWTQTEVDILQELRILAVPYKEAGRMIGRSGTMCHFIIETYNLMPVIAAKREALITAIVEREI